MSANQTFAYCFDCQELHYGVSDSNGVYSRDSASSNHWDHNVHVFGAPNTYQAPICNVLTKLHAGAPISHNEMIIFKLAVSFGELEPHRRLGKAYQKEKPVDDLPKQISLEDIT